MPRSVKECVASRPFIRTLVGGFTLLLLGTMHAPATALDLVWERTWGGGQFEQAEGVAIAPDGSVYLTGQTTSFGTGVPTADEDIFLIKYASNGTIVWQRTYGNPPADPFVSPNPQVASDVEVGPDGSVYVAGSSNAGVLLVKFDPDGNLVWEQTFGDGLLMTRGMAIGTDGSVFVVGLIFPPEAQADALLMKFAPDGTPLWQRTWGGGNTDVAHDVAVASDGSVYGTGATNSFFGDDAFLLKLSSEGTVIWERDWRAGVTGANTASHGVAVGSDQSVYITGRASLSTGQEAFLVKFTPEGSVLWERTWGAGPETAQRVAVAPSGVVYMTGRTGLGAGGGDAFVTEFSSIGKPIAATTWGGVDSESAQDIGIGADGDVYVAAVTSSSPPYTFQQVSKKASKVKSPFLGVPVGTVTTPAGAFNDPNGIVLTPNGSETFAGTTEAVLVRITPQPTSGATVLSEVIEAIPEAPAASSLMQNRPNPFSVTTDVSFRLSREEKVLITVLDVSGRIVKTLASGTFGPGEHRIAWDGTNEDRAPLPSGLYFAQLITVAGKETGKMMLVRR